MYKRYLNSKEFAKEKKAKKKHLINTIDSNWVFSSSDSEAKGKFYFSRTI